MIVLSDYKHSWKTNLNTLHRVGVGNNYVVIGREWIRFYKIELGKCARGSRIINSPIPRIRVAFFFFFSIGTTPNQLQLTIILIEN